jgi:lysophospholipase L1-like esterase
MLKKFTVLLLVALLLSSCTNMDKAEKQPERKMGLVEKERVPEDFIPRNLKVVSAGDSLTEGIGDSTEKGGYLPYLKTMLEKEKGINEVDFSNFGVQGNRTVQLLRRLQLPELKNAVRSADIVILTIGGNDIMKVVKENIYDLQLEKFDEEKVNYEKNLIEIIKSIKMENPDAPVVLVGLYNPFDKWFSDVKEMDEIVAGWNAASQNVISKFGNAYFVEVDKKFASSEENLLFNDYFHPNDKGYALIADSVYDHLTEEVLAYGEEQVYSARKERN